MVNYTKRILIFALARTGSTSLMNLINVHKSIYAISEPFNIGNKEHFKGMGINGICENEISEFKELDLELNRIFLDFNLIKHVWHPSGFPFIESDPGYAFKFLMSKNEYLLKKFDYIIFLNRRNNLKRLVSSLMSMQTGVWDSYQTSAGNIPEEFVYAPLKIDSIKWHLEYDRYYIEYFKSAIVNSGIKFTEVFQEDFFDNKTDVESKIEKFLKLSDFLDLPRRYNYDQMMTIGEYLYSKKHQQNSRVTYDKVPNIQEIEDTFGSDEKGWIFK